VIATATAFDAEMQARIDAHRATRPGHWHTVEAPTALAQAVADASRDDALAVAGLPLILKGPPL